ncbi:hypothetical protein SAMN05720382_101113 [Polaromonas sp. JS666]|nr:hypothetical protein SAMN05720382_101113 [Polaromonas sp. JS666]
MSIASNIPINITQHYTDINVRLYGGWREGPRLTRRAQLIIPQLQTHFPCTFTPTGGTRIQLQAELAFGPLCIPNVVLNNTLAHDRPLRRFYSKQIPWSQCANPGLCGLSPVASLQHDTPCTQNTCGMTAGDILMRSEQKMVDTCIVADIAHLAYSTQASHIVVLSSDTDMWPGVLAALAAGSQIIQIHTKRGGITQPHLVRTIPRQLVTGYTEHSI